MADQSFDPNLPPDDESPTALIDDARNYLREAVPDWEPSDAALEVAILAAAADEGSTLYALLREDAADRFRDYGTTILGVPADVAAPAETTTTWTARNPAPAGGIILEAGTTLAIDAPAGLVGFEVVDDHTLAETETTLAAVTIRAIDAGTAANGADGPVRLDEPSAWVLDVTLDAPATGGTDGDTDEEHEAAIIRAASLLSRAPILPDDFENVAQEIDGVARALVIDNYDHDTGDENAERTVSIYPLDEDGLAVDAATKTAIADLVQSRREVNWIVRVADPTYTTVDVEITVAKRDSTVDDAQLQAAVATAIETDILNPARHGLPLSGDRLTWRQRRTIRRYEVASTADLVRGVDYVDEVLLAEQGDPIADQDVELAGVAPLPLAGTVTVTVIEA